MKKLLVVVDYQTDFVDGALGFPGAEKLAPGIAAAVQATLATGGYVLFTRDTHQDDYLTTPEGEHLPVAHCIAGSAGHQLYGPLHRYETNILPHTTVVDKPTFGCANIGAYAAELCGGAPDYIEICGLVTDICVLSNAILLQSFFPLASLRVLAPLCGTGNQANGQKALDLLAGLGIEISG